MKKQARLMFGITRKKRFTVAMVVVAAVIVMAGLVLGYVGVFGLRSELCEVIVSGGEAGGTFGGVGINCDVIPNINMVRDASFESSTDYSSMLVAGSSEGSIFLTPDAVASAGYDTNSCTGDTARILSIGSDGVMSEKFSGTVTGYKPATLGVITEIDDTRGLWSEGNIRSMAFYGNVVLALTDDGSLVYDFMNNQLSGVADIKLLRKDDDENVERDLYAIDYIDSNESGVIAVSRGGAIYVSQDGRTFSEVYQPDDIVVAPEICGVGSVRSTFAVCYKNGTVVTVTNGKVALSQLPVSGVTSFVSDRNRFVAVDKHGAIYSSSNGIIYENNGLADILVGSDAPLACAAQGKFCFVTDNSELAIISFEDSVCHVDEMEITKNIGSTVDSVFLTDTGLLITGTSDKKAFAINLYTGNTVSLVSENVVVEKIIGVSGDKVYFDSGKKIYRSQILSELSVEGDLEGVDIIADDILIAGHMKTSAGGSTVDGEAGDRVWDIPEDSLWSVYGQGSSVVTSDRAYSGSFSARLNGNGSGVHAMTQTIPGEAKGNFVPGSFYRLSLYAMSDNVPEKAYCWIEGEGFGEYGFELTQLGEIYKCYSIVFAVTDQMMKEGQIRLSIAIEGTGSVMVDNLYLGPDDYDSAGIPRHYSEAFVSGSPSAIRLNNLGIGSDGFAETSLYLMSDDSVSTDISDTSSEGIYDRISKQYITGQSVNGSLEESLRLVKDCNSSPWLVIGPYANQTDIDRLLEYMCGSLTSEYGGRRIDNGTALPWSRQFLRFYIEINDGCGVFTSDTQKESYVNYVISLFTQSEYFSDIKDKALFLDGMRYEGGTMNSNADAHTIDVSLTANDGEGTFIENINADYVLAQYDTPHFVSGNTSGEYINTLMTDGSNCGKVVSSIMTSEADFAEMFLFDASVSFVPSSYEEDSIFVDGEKFINMMTVSGLAKGFTGYDEVYIDIREPLDTAATESVDKFMSEVTVGCYSDGSKTYLVIANPSDKPQSFLINDNMMGRTNSTLRRYDSKGRMIDERSLRYERLRHNLQPGEFIIVEIESV